MEKCICRALDLPDSREKAIEHAEAAVYLMMTQGSVEMGLDGDFCNIPILVDQDIEDQGTDLDQEDVIETFAKRVYSPGL